MSIKAGDLIQVGNQVVVDRAQTAGINSLNIPETRIYELGNYNSAGITRDIPDLTYQLESFDASAALESLLTGGTAATYAADAAGTVYDLGFNKGLDVVSQFKKGKNDVNPFDVAGSIVIPFLQLESIQYRFGLHDDARQTASLRGDSVFYADQAGYVHEEAGTGVAAQSIVLEHPAIPYKGDFVNGTRYALSVTLRSGRRLRYGSDFTEATTAATGNAKNVTLTILAPVDVTDLIRVSYQSPTVASYPQLSNTPASSIKPASIRGKDITVFLGGQTDGFKLGGIQSFQAEWRVQLEKDEEFGNTGYVSQDYLVPDVTGTVDFKPYNYADLMARIKTMAGVAQGSDEVIGAYQYVDLPLEVVLHSPVDGTPLKTIKVPDARFTLPPTPFRVQQKLTMSFPFKSEQGIMQVAKGGLF